VNRILKPKKHEEQPKSVRDWDIKEKVKLIAGSIVQNDNDPGYSYYEDLIPYYFEDDPDRPLIQKKMDNIMKLLNEASITDLKKIWDMDFEDEIWYIT
jgi:hypothetical protein